MGIETTDDVVLQLVSGGPVLISEQDKSVTSARTPYSDSGAELWNTLGIWLQAIDESVADVAATHFHLVTTGLVPPGLARSISEAQTTGEVAACIAKMRKIEENSPESSRRHIDTVFSYGEDKIRALLPRVQLYDAEDRVAGETLRRDLHFDLGIPSHVDTEEVLDYLFGWISKVCLDAWRNVPRRAAWIEKQAFDNARFRIISKLASRAIIARAADAILVTDNERGLQKASSFVQQVRLLASEEDDDLIIEAIDDYLRCDAERVRLCAEGEIQADDLDNFERRLVEHWKPISRSAWRRLQKSAPSYVDDARATGYDVYQEILRHREVLYGQIVEPHYFTRGHFHRLANRLDVGWHPDYKSLLGDN